MPTQSQTSGGNAASVQTTDRVLMIRPVGFLSNPETAGSNAFQANDAESALESQAAALREFDQYVHLLRQAGVEVLVVEDSPQPATPDSIFPNNWISLGADGRVFLYPMQAPNRRLERKSAVLAEIAKRFRVRDIVDLSRFEDDGKYLEGTGSFVLDHEHRIAYACHSSRSHPEAMRAFEERSGYRALWFHATDRHGKPIYHTNVMMSVGCNLVMVCLESVRDRTERQRLVASLGITGKRVMDISLHQVEQFAGNMIELRSACGHPVIALSTRAWRVLTDGQKDCILDCAEPVLAPIDTIERLGGGGARCMVAEIFLPERIDEAAMRATDCRFQAAAV